MRLAEPIPLKDKSIRIEDIDLDPKANDDIDHLLSGLQFIYITPSLKDEVFKILEEMIPLDGEGRRISTETGRPGMELWNILVIGVLRLSINADYNRLHNLVNQHHTVRLFLGHKDTDDSKERVRYSKQCLHDNLCLFTPEILDQINQVVVRAGHELVKQGSGKKSPSCKLHARGDSFVVETDVHYPTDHNLLYDAVRKALIEAYGLAKEYDIQGWRQSHHNVCVFKKLHRYVQTLGQRRGADDDPQWIEAVFDYVNLALKHKNRAEELCAQLPDNADTQALRKWMDYIALLVDQIYRRCIAGETIDHAEKIFSIFEPHTEWVVKGKAGVPMELGVRVHIIEDQDQFILHHAVALNQTDEKLAVPLTLETKERFPDLSSVSFDKGYHSKENQEELAKQVDLVVLPKKGRLSAADQAREDAVEFKHRRQRHSAVESAINGLEHTGLDRCPDHGIDGFKRYVGLSVVARNLKRVGVIARYQEKARAQRKRGPYQKAA